MQAHCINKGIKISLYLKRFYNLTCNVRNLENSFVRRGLLAPRKRALGIPEEKDFKEGERKGGRHQVYQRFFCLMRGRAKLVWDQYGKVPALQSFQEFICYSVQNIKKVPALGDQLVKPLTIKLKLKVKPDHCRLGLGSGSLQAPEQKMAPSCF